MLPKKHRVTIVQFRHNPSPVKKITTPLFSFQIKEKNKDNPRFVVFIPKALDKRSSHRNRMRRVVIESIRGLIPLIQKPVDVSIRPKRIVTKSQGGRIIHELKSALNGL